MKAIVRAHDALWTSLPWLPAARREMGPDRPGPRADTCCSLTRKLTAKLRADLRVPTLQDQPVSKADSREGNPDRVKTAVLTAEAAVGTGGVRGDRDAPSSCLIKKWRFRSFYVRPCCLNR